MITITIETADRKVSIIIDDQGAVKCSETPVSIQREKTIIDAPPPVAKLLEVQDFDELKQLITKHVADGNRNAIYQLKYKLRKAKKLDCKIGQMIESALSRIPKKKVGRKPKITDPESLDNTLAIINKNRNHVNIED
jgi:hypothetical protein